MTLRAEIRQSKPFPSPAVEAYLGVLRTADLLLRDFEEFFRGHGLTEPRYNAIRILRGAGKPGLPCLEVDVLANHIRQKGCRSVAELRTLNPPSSRPSPGGAV